MFVSPCFRGQERSKAAVVAKRGTRVRLGTVWEADVYLTLLFYGAFQILTSPPCISYLKKSDLGSSIEFLPSETMSMSQAGVV